MRHIIRQLQLIDAMYPVQRKLLLVPGINLGRELLATLARQQGSWIGWEVATLATIADKVSVMELARRGRRRGSDVAIRDAVSAAFERAVKAGGVSRELSALAWSAGTRRAVSDAILEARVGGATESGFRAAGPTGVAASLAAIMAHYETVRSERTLADTADVFAAAVQDFESQARVMLDHAIIVATPGWTVRGAPRQLFDCLARHGLHVLAPAPRAAHEIQDALVECLAPQWASVANPNADQEHEADGLNRSVAIFCAGDAADELRSILRQTIAAGMSLDDVEIASTERDSYAITLDALCQQLGVSCTILDGLPLSATRIGRASERWLAWIESGFQSTVLREALESGDLAPGGKHTPTQLSAELRNLKMGWGLEATRKSEITLRSPAWSARTRQFDGESTADFETRRERRTSIATELATFLGALVALAPEPEAEIATAELARRMLSALQFIVARGPAELSTLQRLTERLKEIVAVDGALMPLPSAIASLRQELAGLRAWTDSSKTRKPRRATGGHLHLTSIENAGATGRPLQFIVGLDADRTAGPVMQSPLLPDVLRQRLNERGADLPTTEQHRREREWTLETAIAGSTAKLTLSYAIRTSAESRESGPAPAMLEVARRITDRPELSYGDLHKLLGTPRSPVPTERYAPASADSGTHSFVDGISPAPAEAPVDARDVWLAAMGEGPILLDATATLRESFVGLHAGLRAVDAREEGDAGAYHGLVPDAGVLDPRATGKAISPSSLERIATCGLRWFYSVALNARVPDEPVYDALVWLNPMDRGIALHRIYEVLIRTHVHEQVSGAARDNAVATVVRGVAREMEAVVPAPGDTVRAREVATLLEDALLFVNSEHAAFQQEPWETVALESQFGGENDPALFPLENGEQLRMHGRVDRVDKLRDGTLRLVDYKTGRAFELDNKRGVFDGGRKLQLALYSPAISAQLHAVVSVAEYRFTTRKGDGGIARADEAMLQAAPRIVQSLLNDVAKGRFLPTLSRDDCRYCEYAAVCRTMTNGFEFQSPRAAWAKEHAPSNAHYDGVRLRQSAEDDA